MTGDGRADAFTLQSVSRKDAASNEIRRQIIIGQLRPGERLTEAQLTAGLGVSRATVREALNELSEAGLITRLPYRSMRVTAFTPQQVMDIARVRMQLDLIAVDAILNDLSAARLDTLNRIWEAFAARYDDVDPVVRHDAHAELHRSIWEASGNVALMSIWPVTAAQLTILIAMGQPIVPEREYAVHKQLMDALRAGERATLEEALHDHTIRSAEKLVQELRDSGIADDELPAVQ